MKTYIIEREIPAQARSVLLPAPDGGFSFQHGIGPVLRFLGGVLRYGAERAGKHECGCRSEPNGVMHGALHRKRFRCLDRVVRDSRKTTGATGGSHVLHHVGVRAHRTH